MDTVKDTKVLNKNRLLITDSTRYNSFTQERHLGIVPHTARRQVSPRPHELLRA